MLRWPADENFNNDILRALFRRHPGIDVVRAQDVGLTGIDDGALLAWAAEQSRVLLTHDVSTITAHAYRRVMKGEPMPGVFEVSCDASIRIAVPPPAKRAWRAGRGSRWPREPPAASPMQPPETSPHR